MKKVFWTICAAAALFVCSCNKDETGTDDILASIEDNQLLFNGKTYPIEGYINKDVTDSGIDFWIIDLMCQSETEGFAQGILQGPFMGKDIDLADIKIEEFMFTLVCYPPRTESAAAAAPKEYGFMVTSEGGSVTSSFGENLWEKEEQAGSCFKSGKITSSCTADKCTVTVSATLKDGTTMAAKISRAYEDRTRPQ